MREILQCHADGPEFAFDRHNGRYSVRYRGQNWLGDGCAVLYRKLLRKLEFGFASRSRDVLGEFQQVEAICRSPIELSVMCRVKAYEHHLIFEQQFESGVKNHAGDDKADLNGFPLVAFPSFGGGEWKDDLSGLSYWNSREKISSFNHPVQFRGTAAGCPRPGKNIPLILADEHFNTLVISPASHFMVGTVATEPQPARLECGFSDGVHEIPARTIYRTIFTFGQGVNRTIDRWGQALRRLHGSRAIDKYEDASLTYLSYWTDAGAAYWYNVMPGKNYEQTLVALAEHHRRSDIPVGAYQLDSWWYHRDGGYTSSVTRWLPKKSTVLKRHNSLDGNADKDQVTEASLFPHGLEALQQKIGKPFMAHFKHVSPQSPYIAGNENSDPPVQQFRFIKEIYAIPDGYDETVRFFRYLADQSGWGLATLEHDWINWIYRGLAAMRRIDAGRDYLKGAADAMLDQDPGNNVVKHRTMQVCMATPEITLQTVECPAITSIRTCYDTDLHVRELGKTCEGAWRWWWNTWSGRLVNAVGKHSFHDCRYSNRMGKDHLSSNSELEFLMICLSCGILGLADAIGTEDRELIMRCVNSRGVVLKPERPAEPLDKCYLFDAYTPQAEAGLTVAASNSFEIGRLLYVLDFNCNGAGRTVVNRYGLRDLIVEDAGRVLCYDYRFGACRIITPDTQIERSIEPGDFSYQVLSPVLAERFAVIGVAEKFVTAAEKLVCAISCRGGRLRVVLNNECGDGARLVVWSRLRPGLVELADQRQPRRDPLCPEWHWDPGSQLLTIQCPGDAGTRPEVIIQ